MSLTFTFLSDHFQDSMKKMKKMIMDSSIAIIEMLTDAIFYLGEPCLVSFPLIPPCLSFINIRERIMASDDSSHTESSHHVNHLVHR